MICLFGVSVARVATNYRTNCGCEYVVAEVEVRRSKGNGKGITEYAAW